MKTKNRKQIFLYFFFGLVLIFICNCKKDEIPNCNQSTTYIKAAEGFRHSLALTKDGYLLSWGDNSNGQLGIGTFGVSRSQPVQIGFDYITIAGGEAYSLIVKSDGTLWTCGWNKFGQLGDCTVQGKTLFVEVKSN